MSYSIRESNIYASVFVDCVSSSTGSLTFSEADTKVNIISCSFYHCSSSGYGGCIYSERPTILQCSTFFDCKTTTYASTFFAAKIINASLISISNCTSNVCAYRMTGDYSYIINVNVSNQISKDHISCYTGWNKYNENKYATFVNNKDTNGDPICLYATNSVLSFANMINAKTIASGYAIFLFGHGGNADISNCLFIDSKHSTVLRFYSATGKEKIKISNCWFDLASEKMNSCTTENIVFNANKNTLIFSRGIVCKSIQFSRRICKNSQRQPSLIYYYILIVFSL